MHTDTSICCLHSTREAHQKTKHKKKIWRGTSKMFCFRKTCFSILFPLGLGLVTPYFLGVLIWNFYLTFLFVSTQLWPRFEPQIRSISFAMKFLFVTAKAERKVRLCVWNCLIFLLTEYSTVWPEICRVLSQILLRLLHRISAKNLFGKIYQKFRQLQSYPLFKFLKSSPSFCNFSRAHITLKKFEKIHIGTLTCCLHPTKEAHPKIKYKTKKIWGTFR